jgi:hypothetical protein
LTFRSTFIDRGMARSKSGRSSASLPNVCPHAAEPRWQELLARLVGTRAELDARLEAALERITHLQLDGQDTQACAAMSTLCDTLDVAVEAVASLAAQGS